MKKCVFCGQSLSRGASNEHILAQWLLDAFEIRDTEISPTHMSGADGNVVSTRTHRLKNLVAGGICIACNTGWMSQLETSAQPLLLSLFANETSVVDCDEAQRFLIARWAFKTALTLNVGSNFHKNIPTAHYKHLYENSTTLPDRTVVFAQNHHFTQDFYWLQGSAWIVNDPTDTIGDGTKKLLLEQSYKIGFQFRGLLVVVAFNPLKDFLFSLWRGIHVPLYPKLGRIASFDRKKFPWDDSLQALYSFHLGLELVHNPSTQ
jgi:hypothetical protein